MWKCALLITTPSGNEKAIKYICSNCAETKHDAVNFFLGNPQ